MVTSKSKSTPSISMTIIIIKTIMLIITVFYSY